MAFCTNVVFDSAGNNIGSDIPTLTCLEEIISNVVGKTLLFLGLVTIVFLFVGAIKFVTSSGDPKGIETAKKTMTYAIIGAVVVIGSFILIEIVLKALNLPDLLTGFTLVQ